MIERKFIAEKRKEFQIKNHIDLLLRRVGASQVKLKKTPLGEKIMITAARPGLVVGRKGENIRMLTAELKKKFNLENPQIEIEEVANASLDPVIVGERIASTLERFGSGRFKSIGHKVLEDIMRAGALGAEIVVSGKIPSARARRWRFYQGYLKKSGFIAQEKVLTAYVHAVLKTGVVGIQVRIMPGDLELPDKVVLLDHVEKVTEEATETGEVVSKEVEKIPADKAPKVEVKKVAEKSAKPKAKKTAKKATKKVAKKAEEKKEDEQ